LFLASAERRLANFRREGPEPGQHANGESLAASDPIVDRPSVR
jgi:hypothetical protein